MAKQPKPKYPLDKEKQSRAYIDGNVHTRLYKTTPQVNIAIMGVFDDNTVNDLQNAVDEVLKHHRK